MCKKIEYSWISGTFAVANEKILSECSELYSNHYGIWGEKGIHPGKAVRLSPEKLCIWLDSENVTLSLKTEIYITMNLREWRHFLKLRTSKAAHPQMRQVAIMIFDIFKEKLPVLFDDIDIEE